MAGHLPAFSGALIHSPVGHDAGSLHGQHNFSCTLDAEANAGRTQPYSSRSCGPRCRLASMMGLRLAIMDMPLCCWWCDILVADFPCIGFRSAGDEAVDCCNDIGARVHCSLICQNGCCCFQHMQMRFHQRIISTGKVAGKRLDQHPALCAGNLRDDILKCKEAAEAGPPASEAAAPDGLVRCFVTRTWLGTFTLLPGSRNWPCRSPQLCAAPPITCSAKVRGSGRARLPQRHEPARRGTAQITTTRQKYVFVCVIKVLPPADIAARQLGRHYLQRYFLLIAFRCYLGANPMQARIACTSADAQVLRSTAWIWVDTYCLDLG